MTTTTSQRRRAAALGWAVTVLLAGLLPIEAGADTWRQVNEAGFGNPDNQSALAMAEFDGYVYVATVNHETGSEVWKAPGGAGGWRDVTPPWDAAIQRPRAMAVFGRRLYVGTDTGQVWQTSGEFRFQPCVRFKPQPGCDRVLPPQIIELWADVTPDHPEWAPSLVSSLAVFGPYLYAATSAPLQIWRTVDGRHWAPVVTDAFDDPSNNDSGTLGTFRGELYVGTSRREAGRPGEKGGGLEIWRTGDGVAWHAVVATGEPGALMPSGFGFPGNGTSTALSVFEDRLYVTTVNHANLAQVWRFDGLGWEEATPADTLSRGVLRLQTMAVFEHRLFVGEGIRPEAALIWATRDAEDWTLSNFGGFGDSSVSIDALTPGRSALFAAAMNVETGVQIWARPRLIGDILPDRVRAELCARIPSLCARPLPGP